MGRTQYLVRGRIQMNEVMKSGGDFDKNPPVQVNQYDQSMKCFCAAYEEIFKMSHAYLNAMLGADADILVVGAGTGAELCQFKSANPNWKILGLDPSKEMLSIASDKVKEKGLEQVELFHGFTHELNKQEAFDGATCILVMQFLEDDGSKLQLLKDIAVTLKKGSTLVLVDAYGNPNTIEFNNTLKAWKKYVVLQGVDENIVEDGFNNQILKRLEFVSQERILELLDLAGFENPSKFYTGFLYGGWAATKR